MKHINFDFHSLINIMCANSYYSKIDQYEIYLDFLQLQTSKKIIL